MMGKHLKLTLPSDAVSDVLLKESKWTKMFFGEGQASLSFSHLNKDDEGLYTLRIMSRGGVSDHSAFLFVRGAAMDGIEAEGGKKPHGRKGQGRGIGKWMWSLGYCRRPWPETAPFKVRGMSVIMTLTCE